MHSNITGPVSAGESSVELPSQLIGIELCSTSVSSAYTREQRCVRLTSGQRCILQPPRLKSDHPLPFGSNPDFTTFARKTVNRTMRNGSFDCRGNSSRHDDASCWCFSHMSPSSCSSSWSLEQERANSSAPRDCTSPETTSASAFTRSAMSSGSRFCLCAGGL